jgi:TRAP-type C4-dicarboxylate transport system substrate-binding protein
MRTPLLLALSLILILSLLAACGGAATDEEEAPAPTTAPAATATQAPTATTTPPTATTAAASPAATEAPAEMSALEKYAAENAGGPGAIYVGDINQLVGPAKSVEQGDFDGNVTLESLERHLWIYESPFYEELLTKAKLTDPTPMTYDGEPITIQHACINRALLPCVALETFFAPNLLERTNGKVEFITSSFPELGLAGPDTLSLVTDGTLDSATIYGGYVGGEMPPIEIQNLWGIYNSREQEFEATQAVIKDIEELVLSETGGVIMNHNWYAGNDQFFFCREKIESLDDFEGKKTRSHSAALSDWINGMGADAQFLAFAEVYTAIERGILDCGVTGADAGYGQRWYEVTDYLVGPLVSFPSNNNVINGTKWAEIPEDLQQIILEEAAKSELEALRISAIQNEMGQIKNTTERGAGQDAMEFVPFSDEMNFRSLNTAVMEHVVPAWVNRVGNTSHPIIADTFNNKVGPIVGLRIEADGTVVKIN